LAAVGVGVGDVGLEERDWWGEIEREKKRREEGFEGAIINNSTVGWAGEGR